MSESKELCFKVELVNGSMKVSFGDFNLALISHALRIANLEIDNIIISSQQAKSSPIEVPKTIIDKLRG